MFTHILERCKDLCTYPLVTVVDAMSSFHERDHSCWDGGGGGDALLSEEGRKEIVGNICQAAFTRTRFYIDTVS